MLLSPLLLPSSRVSREVQDNPNNDEADDDRHDPARLFRVVLEELDDSQKHDEYEENDHGPLHYFDGLGAVCGPGPEAAKPEKKSQEVGEQRDREHEPDEDIEQAYDLRKGSLGARKRGKQERGDGEHARGEREEARRIGKEHTEGLFARKPRLAERVGGRSAYLALRRVVDAAAEERVLQQAQNSPDGNHHEKHDDAPEEVRLDLLRPALAEIQNVRRDAVEVNGDARDDEDRRRRIQDFHDINSEFLKRARSLGGSDDRERKRYDCRKNAYEFHNARETVQFPTSCVTVPPIKVAMTHAPRMRSAPMMT